MKKLHILLVVFVLAAAPPLAVAEDWPSWRGRQGTGVSMETGLVSSWSVEGENLIWHDEFVGRSTPAVFDGRVCASGRVGEGVTRQEIVACWSAESGERLWERRFNVFNTTVPFSRVGWGSVTGDPETGYLYSQHVDGRFTCFDAKGETVWEHRLGESFGRMSGYGGRTHSPLVDEDRVIISMIGAYWGELGPPRHRFYAFDKRDGRVVWVSTPGNSAPADFNTQGTPIVTEIDGERLLIGGGSDGWVYAVRSRTGQPVWSFRLSRRGINTTPVASGSTIIMSHSEENLDTGRMGRIVAIDATGNGNVTGTHERWRIDEVLSGFASPALHEGRAYFADNSANIHAIDIEQGRVIWSHNFGRVGKGSPVVADGKIYVADVNGRVSIIAPGAEAAETLDETLVSVPDGRHAEIYGSPAVAYGRLYLATEAGIYCVGDERRAFEPKSSPVAGTPAGEGDAVALQVVPAESVAQAGDSIEFEVRRLDARGRVIDTADGAEWSLEGLEGGLEGGVFSIDTASRGQTGKVVARLGALQASGRVRVGAALPFEENFDSGRAPKHWLGVARFKFEDLDGSGRLYKAPSPRGINRGTILMGPASLSDYVVQADVMSRKRGRRQGDVGVINSGYALELLGPHQKVRIQSWAAERRMAGFAEFAWEADTWYTMKLQVDYEGDEATVRGRIWITGEPEPEGWAIEVNDPLPIRAGSPGLTGDAPANVYFDNIKVVSR